MKKTVRQLREERGESQMQLAGALGATLQEIQDLESGIASPSVERLRLLTEMGILEAKPGETRELKLGWRVRWPKDKAVQYTPQG